MRNLIVVLSQRTILGSSYVSVRKHLSLTFLCIKIITTFHKRTTFTKLLQRSPSSGLQHPMTSQSRAPLMHIILDSYHRHTTWPPSQSSSLHLSIFSTLSFVCIYDFTPQNPLLHFRQNKNAIKPNLFSLPHTWLNLALGSNASFFCYIFHIEESKIHTFSMKFS